MNIINLICVSGLVAAVATVTIGCNSTKQSQAQEQSPPANEFDAPILADKPRSYSYIYYPNSRVYYLDTADMYYWMEGSQWQASEKLPRSVHLDKRQPIRIETDRDTPYMYHERYYGKTSWLNHNDQQDLRYAPVGNRNDLENKKLHTHGNHNDSPPHGTRSSGANY